MTNIDWPTTLPQYLLQSQFRLRPGNTVLRTQMEIGRPKQRVRDVATYVYVDATMRFSMAQLTIFEAFWTTDLGQGILPFNWLHPLHRTAAVCEFIEDYQVQAAGPNVLVPVKLMVFL